MESEILIKRLPLSSFNHNRTIEITENKYTK